MNQNNQLRGHFYRCFLSIIASKCTLTFFAIMISTDLHLFLEYFSPQGPFLLRLGSDLNLKVLLLGICLVVIIWGVVKRWLFGWLQVEIGSIQVREFHLPYHQVEIPISGNANCTKSPELNTWENDKNTFRPDINVKTLIIT